MIVVVCPGNVVTGGPEALHQLTDMANQVLPGSAAICYTPFTEIFEKNEAYNAYQTPIILRESIPTDAIVVIPEAFPELVFEFKQRCVLWWLSIDNFPTEYVDTLAFFDLHVAQSKYAQKSLLSNYDIESVMLSDYINADFKSSESRLKKQLVAVNPSKGANLIRRFRFENPEVPVVVLEKMSRVEVRNTLANAMAYIDFGHHPGKDRLPREATLQDAVVFVKRAGAAQFLEDVPLESQYFFDDISELQSKLRGFFDGYEAHLQRQNSYRQHVAEQLNIFRAEVTEFLDTCSHLTGPKSKSQQTANYYAQLKAKSMDNFLCPVCGDLAQSFPEHREDAACPCGATWRTQACLLSILEGIGYEPDLNPTALGLDLSRLGLGISDNWLLAKRLSNLFFYTNSFFHRFPDLDVMNPPESATGLFDFVSCSDVLEHTPPPATQALAGIFKVLKPGGVAILSVPCTGHVETDEYYPNLKDWFVKDGVMYWWDDAGKQHLDESPEFHGGEGQTLTFRLWSYSDLMVRCQEAGFREVFAPSTLPPLASGVPQATYGGLVIARK